MWRQVKLIGPCFTGGTLAFLKYKWDESQTTQEVKSDPQVTNATQMMHKFANESVTQENVKSYYSSIQPAVYNEFLEIIDF